VRATPFLAVLSISLVLGLIVIAALPKTGLARPSAEITWTADLYAQKTGIAGAISGQRVLIVGGSGTLFSFDTRVAGMLIGKPVVNFGTHAGLGIAYILDRAARVMRRDDIVVLAPEYELLQQPAEVNEYAIQLAIYFDRDYINSQPLRERPHYWVGYGVLTSLLEGVRMMISGPPRGRADVQLDGLGNARGNSVALSNTAGLGAEGPTLPPPSVTPAAIALLREFMKRASSEGIRVFVMPPALASTPSYRSAAFQQFQRRLPALFASLGMVPIGKSQDAFLAPQDMYDSVYHANDRGRMEYTARMLSALCRKMTCAHER